MDEALRGDSLLAVARTLNRLERSEKAGVVMDMPVLGWLADCLHAQITNWRELLDAEVATATKELDLI